MNTRLRQQRTREGAEKAKKQYQEPHMRSDGSTYRYDAEIEEWDFKE